MNMLRPLLMRLNLFAALLLSAQFAFAHHCPVQGTLSIAAPYPAYLSDYANANIKKATEVIQFVNDHFTGKGTRFNILISSLIGRYNEQTGMIGIVRQQKAIVTAADAPIVLWKDVETFADGLSPLTPIIITSGKDLPLVQTALGVDNQPANMEYIVPAVFLKYKGDKEFNDAAIKDGMLVIDLTAIAASGGLALATKVTWARRLWALAEVAGAAGNIALNFGNIASGSNLEKALGYYNVAMALIGVKNAGQGLYNYAKKLPAQTKNLLKSNGNLKALLQENYQKFKTSLSSAKGENGYAALDEHAQTKLRDAEGMFDDLMGGAKGGDWQVIKNGIVSRLTGKQGWSLKYTDVEIQEILTHGKGINLSNNEIEDIILNGCRPDKSFSKDNLISQSNFWNEVKQRGYPNLFQSLREYEQFSGVIKQLAQEWNLPVNSIFTQGSSLRMSKVSDIGDLDIAIKVDVAMFDNLVTRFKNNASNPIVKARVGNNGKIGGVDMKKGVTQTGSFVGEFYLKFENSFGQSFQGKLGVSSIQISIIKEGSSIDISPFLKLK